MIKISRAILAVCYLPLFALSAYSDAANQDIYSFKAIPMQRYPLAIIAGEYLEIDPLTLLKTRKMNSALSVRKRQRVQRHKAKTAYS